MDTIAELVEKNQGLVYAVLQRRFRFALAKYPSLREDCIAAGLEGLWRAARSFDPTKGTFSTFAWSHLIKRIGMVIYRNRERMSLEYSAESLERNGDRKLTARQLQQARAMLAVSPPTPEELMIQAQAPGRAREKLQRIFSSPLISPQDQARLAVLLDSGLLPRQAAIKAGIPTASMHSAINAARRAARIQRKGGSNE